MVVNDNAGNLTSRGVLRFIASSLLQVLILADVQSPQRSNNSTSTTRNTVSPTISLSLIHI